MILMVVVMAGMLIYIAACILYVYRFRGQQRYQRFSQYLRKSWPVFAPLNCLLYMATAREARQPVLKPHYIEGIERLRRNWRRIRDEAMELHASGAFEAASAPGAAGHHDLGFRTFYKRGWRKFYLKWYADPHRSAERLCPTTVRLLEGIPGIRAAMFSVLPAGAELSMHSDPLACSLRYHLGLDTPGTSNCYICVDGHFIPWRNGEDFVFDETYPHFARNDSTTNRVILMCDVERPMNLSGRAFNRLYAGLAWAMTVPNTPEDRQGPISWLFARLAPLRESGMALKRRHRPLYTLLKYLLNASLLLLLFAAIIGVIGFLSRLFGLLGMS